MVKAGCREASIALGLVLAAGGCGSRVVNNYGAAGAGSSDGMSAHGGAHTDDSSPGSPIARGGAVNVAGSSASTGGMGSTVQGGSGSGGSTAVGGSSAGGGSSQGGSSGSSITAGTGGATESDSGVPLT